MKVKIDFTLPRFSATEILTWEFHVDEYDKGRYDMILSIYLLTSLVLNIENYEHIIESGEGHLKGSTSTMIDLGTYNIKDLNTGKNTPEEYFTNDRVDELYELEKFRTSTKI